MNVPPGRDGGGAGALARLGAWDGTTYHGRAPLKAAPFEHWVVGGYIFLAGLSGTAAILSALCSASRRPELAGAARRGRYLALLAPTAGSGLLVYDLHTPKRFYNMLRVAKGTSPMSIGTWILMGFSAAAGTAAAAQLGADLRPRQRWLGTAARAATVPAAVAGVGLGTYTATLLAATSTPAWAASPEALAVRFAASSLATGAAALSLGEEDASTRGRLDAVLCGALTLEAVAAAAVGRAARRTGVAEAYDGPAGRAERLGGTVLGVVVPLGLLAASATLASRPRALSAAAALAALAGSAIFRSATLAVGAESAARPDIAFRFTEPRNLPRRG